MHVDGKKGLSSEFSLIFAEADSTIVAAIIGTPFNPQQDVGNGNNLDGAATAVNDVLPECNLRELVRTQTALILGGGTAAQNYGNAVVRVSLSNQELRIIIVTR